MRTGLWQGLADYIWEGSFHGLVGLEQENIIFSILVISAFPPPLATQAAWRVSTPVSLMFGKDSRQERVCYSLCVCVCVRWCSRGTGGYFGSGNFVGVVVEQGSSVHDSLIFGQHKPATQRWASTQIGRRQQKVDVNTTGGEGVRTGLWQGLADYIWEGSFLGLVGLEQENIIFSILVISAFPPPLATQAAWRVSKPVSLMFGKDSRQERVCYSLCVCVRWCSRGTGGYFGSGNFVGVVVEQGSSVYTIV